MAFGSFGGSSSQPMADINTTPLVDVMLVLLIIFIVTAPLMTQAIRVDLPRTAATPAPPLPEALRLSLDGAGKLYWNDAAVDESGLAARLASAAAQRPQPEVHLAADRETRYQRLAEVMAAVRAAGLERLGFVTVPGARPTP